MLIGYARVSTSEQVYGLEAQVRNFCAAGCTKLFSEPVSSIAQRKQLEAALEWVSSATH
ncbi:recombinase family protein [Porphyrobacter sp. AAP60]|uniref:recombinase family protein n=1 Tax=Porphyrobacter sp. AAP60 TaxID=1523423 RepID=UPI0009E87725|nr:recombinase family protein [Porphyrobacter sp. AAP60]